MVLKKIAHPYLASHIKACFITSPRVPKGESYLLIATMDLIKSILIAIIYLLMLILTFIIDLIILNMLKGYLSFKRYFSDGG